MAGVQTLAQELAAAKATAHTALNTALSGYVQANYSVANWTILTGYKTTGDTAIDAAGTVAAVNAARDAAIANMAGVLPIPNPVQTAIVGVQFSLNLQPLWTNSPLTVAGLPSGLKYIASQRTIAGVPSAAVTNKVVTIKAKNASGTIVLLETLTFTVDPLPLWAWGTFNGWCLIGSNDYGSATMTVTKLGKVAGKLSAGGSNYAFKAASYAAGSSPIAGFSVTTNAVAGKSIVPLTAP
jgi:hypothetical protein